MPYTISFKPAFFRALKKLPKSTVSEVNRTIQAIKTAPKAIPAKKLKGLQSLYRIRLGDYRLVYHRDDKNKKILFVLFAHRKDIYRQLK